MGILAESAPQSCLNCGGKGGYHRDWCGKDRPITSAVIPTYAPEKFVRYLIVDRKLGLGYHADTPFDEYVDGRGERVFSDEEAAQLQRVADLFEADLNGIAIEILDSRP